MKCVKANAAPVAICEPALDAPEFFGSKVTRDLEALKAGCDMIVSNRWSDEFADVADKVYTRDLLKRDFGRVVCDRLGLTYSESTLAEDGGVYRLAPIHPPRRSYQQLQ